MKRILPFLILAATLGGCAPKADQDPHGRVGATTGDIQWFNPTLLPAITGNNATITLWSMTGGRSSVVYSFYSTVVNRLVYSGRADQAITLLLQVQHGSDTTWRTVNGWNSGDPIQGHPSGCTDASPGRGLGETLSASTDLYCNMVMQAPNVRLQAVTGGTGPTAAPYDIGVYYDPAPPL